MLFSEVGTVADLWKSGNSTVKLKTLDKVCSSLLSLNIVQELYKGLVVSRLQFPCTKTLLRFIALITIFKIF